jgi:MoxR domain in the MoxR-vWA-beta-propeller ternary systems
VGASNELPESEELDALYDRFLIRRQVAQVSAAQLSTLARIAAGGRLQEIVPGAEQPPAKAGELTMDDYRSVAVAAHGTANAVLMVHLADGTSCDIRHAASSATHTLQDDQTASSRGSGGARQCHRAADGAAQLPTGGLRQLVLCCWLHRHGLCTLSQPYLLADNFAGQVRASGVCVRPPLHEVHQHAASCRLCRWPLEGIDEMATPFLQLLMTVGLRRR